MSNSIKNKIDCKTIDWAYTNVKGFSFNEILDLKNGGLKFLKVEPNSSYPEHMHTDKIEYAVVIEGNPTIIIHEEIFLGKVGDVFIFPCKTKHAIINKSNYTAFLLIGNIDAK